MKYKDIKIGSDVWIGTGVTVLPGVTIGDGAIIGAGSVVTKDIESFSINAGVPCKWIRDRFGKRAKEAIIKSEWWNWPSQKLFEHRELFQVELDDYIVCQLEEISHG